MGIKLERQKKRNYLVSGLYLLRRILPLSQKAQFRLFLNLEWVFHRFAYEISATVYDYERHPIVSYRLEFLKRCISTEQSVIDLGCGYGFVSSLVADFSKEVVGIDRNKESIVQAKSKYLKPNLEFFSDDAVEFLANNKKKYNVIILSHILEHLDNPEHFLKRFRQYFEYFYIELPDYDGTVLNCFRKDEKMDLNYSDGDHVSEFDRVELRRIFLNCGLREIRSEFIFGIQRYWCEVIRDNEKAVS